jgi:hypothetical protein
VENPWNSFAPCSSGEDAMTAPVYVLIFTLGVASALVPIMLCALWETQYRERWQEWWSEHRPRWWRR